MRLVSCPTLHILISSNALGLIFRISVNPLKQFLTTVASPLDEFEAWLTTRLFLILRSPNVKITRRYCCQAAFRPSKLCLLPFKTWLPSGEFTLAQETYNKLAGTFLLVAENIISRNISQGLFTKILKETCVSYLEF